MLAMLAMLAMLGHESTAGRQGESIERAPLR